MDNQSTVQDAIDKGTTASSQILRGRGLDITGAAEQPADNEPAIAQLPVVGLAYRFFDGWRAEFSPRLYGEDSVVLLQSNDEEGPPEPGP